jgi:hypothetical protein
MSSYKGSVRCLHANMRTHAGIDSILGCRGIQLCALADRVGMRKYAYLEPSREALLLEAELASVHGLDYQELRRFSRTERDRRCDVATYQREV